MGYHPAVADGRDTSDGRDGTAWLRRGVQAAAPVALLAGALLAPALWGGEALLRRDVLQQYWALRVVAARAFAAGHLPLWDPSQQAGLPLLANPHAAVLYPLHLLDAWLSFPRAYAWEVLFHLVVAATGARALARRLGLGAIAAATTGLAFALAGPVMSLVDFGPDLAGIAWIPWAVVVLASPWPRTRRAAALGAILCVQALSGNPQAAVLSGLGVLAWLATRPGRRADLAVAAGGAAVGGLLAGVQLAPAWVLLRHSTRATGLANVAWAFQPARVLGLATPYPFGHYLHAPWFWAHFLAWGSPATLPFDLSVYLGAAVLAAGLLGLGRDRATAFGLSLVGLGLALGLGAHGPLGWLLRIPPLGYFRYPEKYLALTALGAAVLAGLGVARVVAGQCTRRRITGVAVGFGALLLVGVATRILPGPARGAMALVLRATHGRTPPAEALAALQGALLQAGVLGLLVVGIAAAPLGGLARLRGHLVAVVAATDLMVAAAPLVVTGPIALYRHPPRVVAELGRLAPTRPYRFLRDLRYLNLPLPPHPTLAGEIALRTHSLQTLKGGSPGPLAWSRPGATARCRWPGGGGWPSASGPTRGAWPRSSAPAWPSPALGAGATAGARASLPWSGPGPWAW